ncbi:GalNAc-alpha-(1-_4)-GalNAc-alpha-(1-_3)-diNAcBac-PP-undecaprenol alpha-1,4-N-acetyl-D-galactosaminyltransferase [Zobellia uliginosa]|uniref:GalNAc-alpha-(1->4)-GalNAc-alpha-(1->3)-diNAcBac-PP-undecaprenol alpha-1,4-N-acetyl-D-galactosaminyltransferase n=1 Tax=Zobellia uliginosa TaxID=143224 RepID=A0ABY1KNC1_9FLAO|nr:glycosyltransferase [Zobellia uliginosa]SIS51237.1 GalNAc-alpha-(1->4)-GalNAc-alpha-(1->3)-diNAcBac-PP-undecaprenol alpha-1,4-N-acetyl-D-galactosaminyltransferase [Zobellia uliginosa]
MERKKIAFVIYSLGSGGAERVVTGLANDLIKRHDIIIITLIKATPFYSLDQRIQIVHCSEEIKTNTNVIRSLLDGVNRVKAIQKFIKQFHIELLISFMTTSNIYSIWAAKWSKIPCIISERANHNVDIPPKSLIKLRNYSYKYCDFLIVQTEGNKEYYTKIISPNKIVVIQNPVGKLLQSKRQLNLNSNHRKQHILNVGSLKSGKAQDLLINAFANIPNVDWKLIFVGDGPLKQELIKLAENLGVSNQTLFVGKKKDVHTYYNEASIFVFTSEHEGFPNALMEALFFGIPSISTNCPYGPSDLISDGENGFLIPVGNQKILESKLIELMKNKELQDKFRTKAIESTKNLRVDIISEKWEKYINQLV